MPAWLSKQLPHALAALAVGSLILLTGFAALRAQSEARQLHARETARRQLDGIADNIAQELAALRAEVAAVAADLPRHRAILQGRADALTTTPHAIWWSDGRAVDFLSTTRFDIPAAQMTALLGDTQRAPLQILTTNDGLDVLLLEQRIALDDAAGAEWVGAALSVMELVKAVELGDVIASGMNVALVGGDGTPVFWTTPTPLPDPVASAIHVDGVRWELRAAPLASWAAAPQNGQTALIVALLAAACGLGVFGLAKLPQALRADVARLTAELVAKDSDLSRLLRSRSQIESQLVTDTRVVSERRITMEQR